MKLPRIDGGDALGVTGLTLVCGGVSALCGPAWAAIAIGLPLLVLYVFKELR